MNVRLAVAVLCLGFAVPAEAACPNAEGDGSSLPAPQLAAADDGTVTDAANGLMWKRCLQGQSGPDCASGTATAFRWVDALNEARGDTFAGHDDWRLPKVEELCAIVAADGTNPAVDPNAFPGAQSAEAWTASSNLDFATGAWAVDFASGEAVVGVRDDPKQVRLVRDAP
jgi:hypothetical protein